MNAIAYEVKKISCLNNKISEIVLSPADNNKKVSFLPGQYVYIYFNDEDSKLPYSIASSPIENDLKLLISNGKLNKILNFFKFNLKKDILISEAQGEAYYRDNRKVILGVSKGLSISPIISITEDLLLRDKKTDYKIFIYHVLASDDDIVFNKYFKSQQEKLNLEYTPFVTNNSYSLNELYNRFNSIHNDLTKADFYVFGSKLFVLDIYKELLPYCNNNFYSDLDVNQSNL